MAEGSVSACGRRWGWGRLRVTSSTRSPAKDIPELSQAPRSWVSPSLNQHPPPGNCFSLDGNRMLGSLGGRGRRPLRTVMGNVRLPGSHDRTRKATISFGRNLPCSVSRENRAEPLQRLLSGNAHDSAALGWRHFNAP